LSELDLSLGLLVALAACGAVLGLDAVSWPQAMISRPVVAATLGGALFGDAASGFLVGAVLELLALGRTPYGAAIYPETGPAGLLAGAGLAAGGVSGIGALLVAVASGLVIGWIGAMSVRMQRALNERLLAAGDLAAPPKRLESRHRLAMTLDAVRAGTLTAAFALPVMLLVKLTDGISTGEGAVAASALLLAGLGLAGGVGAAVMRRRPTDPLLLLAGGAAAVAMIVTGIAR
jgi:PTS system mannose-specific IIC component